MFWAVDSVFPLSYLDSVFPILTQEMQNCNVFYEIRVDMTPYDLKRMWKYNIRYIQAGVEALSDHLLHLMNKGTTCVQNIYFLKNCVESGMHILWNLISGIPGETEEDYQIYLSLLPKLYHLPPPSGIWSISYQRGAEYYHNQQKYEIQLIPKTTMNQFLYPFSKSSLQNITYFYDDVNVHRLFTIKKIKLIQKISNLIDEWKKKWLENKTPYLLVRQNTIYDFRGDTEIQTELTEGETNLLNYLSEPRQEELLSFVKATTLQNMMDRGWIVKQSGYYLSLVNRKKFLYKAFIPETFQSLVQ